MDTNKSVVEIKHITVAFEGREVLSDFSLAVAQGEKIAITGPSGSGKSTILRCMLGLVVPQAGTVRLFGETVSGKTIWDLRQHLAYVGQEPDMGDGTVREVLERPFAFKANAHLHDNLKQRTAWFARFNLPEGLLDKDMATLSGGEKQRVALVSAGLLGRSLILLDEASSALDKANKETVAAFFGEAEGLTVVSIAHDSAWRSFSDRVIELRGIPFDQGEQK